VAGAERQPCLKLKPACLQMLSTNQVVEAVGKIYIEMIYKGVVEIVWMKYSAHRPHLVHSFYQTITLWCRKQRGGPSMLDY
jgi:hypothetical protein